MRKSHFILTSSDTGSFKEGPSPEFVRVPLAGHGTKTVKKKAEVFPGMLVAEHKSIRTGNMHAPVSGTVTEVTEKYVAIKAGPLSPPEEGGEGKPAEATPVALTSLSGEELQGTLKELGVDLRPLRKRCDVLILNGLNPEPGITFCETLFSQYTSTLAAGLALLKEITPARKMILAAPEGSGVVIEGAPTSYVKPVYPNSVDEVLAAFVTGTENCKGVAVLPLHTLFLLGRVAESGLPLTETIVSVQGKSYMAKIGTPVGALIKHAGIPVSNEDRVILGGPLRGVAISDLNKGICKDTQAVMVVPQNAFPNVTDHACIGCGECVRHCPARIRPNMISRYTEFSMYDRCKAESIDVCMECGICGYYCPARRPLLQLIRLAKHQIALAEAQVTECALQGGE